MLRGRLGGAAACACSSPALQPRRKPEPPHTLHSYLPAPPSRPPQVLKEKLREALEANKQLQGELQKRGGGAAPGGAGRAALGAENKENAAR